MTRPSLKLDMYRFYGGTVSLGCVQCPLLKECGGYTTNGGGWSCMEKCSNCDPAKCDLVCLKKPAVFTRDLCEVGGFGFEDIPELTTINVPEVLPRYIPVIQHGYARDEISLPWAALPLRGVLRHRNGLYHPVADTPAEIRAHFGLDTSTRTLLLGTGKDKPIESYWKWSEWHGAPRAIAQLGFSYGVVPNYSLFLEDPRPQHLFNRKRSLICAAEWSREGLPAIPYLQAISPADWDFWERFLRAHPEVNIVSKEFQTGSSAPKIGELNIDSLSRLQDKIGRRLHVVAIGAARYRGSLRHRFDNWSIVDSVPFMKAIKRRVASNESDRLRWRPAWGEPVADLLQTNVSMYARWLVQSGTH